MTTESIDATQEAGRAGGPTPTDWLLERLVAIVRPDSNAESWRSMESRARPVLVVATEGAAARA
jgi:hypothetical protein